MIKPSAGELSEGYFRWRCRRGMKELDFILTRFIGAQFDCLDYDTKVLFNQLLDEEDMLLWYWLSGKTKPDAEYTKFAALVEVICVAGYHKK